MKKIRQEEVSRYRLKPGMCGGNKLVILREKYGIIPGTERFSSRVLIAVQSDKSVGRGYIFI